jgi:hypothetical protein
MLRLSGFDRPGAKDGGVLAFPVVDDGMDGARRWTARWKTAGADVTCPVRELAGVPATASVPVRGFIWRAGAAGDHAGSAPQGVVLVG